MERRGRQDWGEAPKDGEAVAMETEWGPRKEKAKGQLGNFLKGAKNSRVCVLFTHLRPGGGWGKGAAAFHGSQGGRLCLLPPGPSLGPH